MFTVSSVSAIDAVRDKTKSAWTWSHTLADGDTGAIDVVQDARHVRVEFRARVFSNERLPMFRAERGVNQDA